jgi:hypothetical protein
MNHRVQQALDVLRVNAPNAKRRYDRVQAKQAYEELRRLWNDQDCRASFTPQVIQEVRLLKAVIDNTIPELQPPSTPLYGADYGSICHECGGEMTYCNGCDNEVCVGCDAGCTCGSEGWDEGPDDSDL